MKTNLLYFLKEAEIVGSVADHPELLRVEGDQPPIAMTWQESMRSYTEIDLPHDIPPYAIVLRGRLRRPQISAGEAQSVCNNALSPVRDSDQEHLLPIACRRIGEDYYFFLINREMEKRITEEKKFPELNADEQNTYIRHLTGVLDARLQHIRHYSGELTEENRQQMQHWASAIAGLAEIGASVESQSAWNNLIDPKYESFSPLQKMNISLKPLPGDRNKEDVGYEDALQDYGRTQLPKIRDMLRLFGLNSTIVEENGHWKIKDATPYFVHERDGKPTMQITVTAAPVLEEFLPNLGQALSLRLGALKTAFSRYCGKEEARDAAPQARIAGDNHAVTALQEAGLKR